MEGETNEDFRTVPVTDRCEFFSILCGGASHPCSQRLSLRAAIQAGTSIDTTAAAMHAASRTPAVHWWGY